MRRAAQLVKEHGVSVRLHLDGSLTISPSDSRDSDEAELDRELEEFNRKQGYL